MNVKIMLYFLFIYFFTPKCRPVWLSVCPPPPPLRLMVQSWFIHKILAEHKRRGLHSSRPVTRYIPGEKTRAALPSGRPELYLSLIRTFFSPPPLPPRDVSQQPDARHGFSLTHLPDRVSCRDTLPEDARRGELSGFLLREQCKGMNGFVDHIYPTSRLNIHFNVCPNAFFYIYIYLYIHGGGGGG